MAGRWGLLAAAVVWALAMPQTGPAEPAAGVPLPGNVRIVPAAPSIPPHLAAYLGKWSGTWDGIMPTVLVVERVTPTTAETIYAWGAAPRWHIAESGWVRVVGRFTDGALRLSLPLPATVTYRLLPDGTLDATYVWHGYRSRARMVRVKE